jgi:hypothetical protein
MHVIKSPIHTKCLVGLMDFDLIDINGSLGDCSRISLVEEVFIKCHFQCLQSKVGNLHQVNCGCQHLALFIICVLESTNRYVDWV